MNLQNTPIQEKFKMLAYLQSNIKGVGQFIITYLKTKQTFQISFINGILFSTQADDIETCLKATIIELDIRYKALNKRSFYTDYEMQSNVEKYKERISELENKLKFLEEKYSRDVVGVEKRRRGRPKKVELTPLQSNGVKEYLEEKNKMPSEYKGMFSELEIQKEMIRVSPNLDIKYIIKGNSKRYREERKKAYKRLYNRKRK
tara:strand:+ start:651 stop:1259 length:609 start_codon:yes stop_codon:yes gene_type:complete